MTDKEKKPAKKKVNKDGFEPGQVVTFDQMKAAEFKRKNK